MFVCTAPDHLPEGTEPLVFLAGGISNCPDWQKTAIGLLGSHQGTVCNPRRPVFALENPQEARLQIQWEFTHLRSATHLLFWFPAQSICPIALYELGVWSAHGTPLAVGCDPDYLRRFDVIEQLSLARAEVNVKANLEETVRALIVLMSERPERTNVLL